MEEGISMDDSQPDYLLEETPAMKRFKESRAKEEALCQIPYYEETCLYFPGRMDCYRLRFKKDRDRIMTDCSLKTLDYFNRTHGTDYKFDKYVDLVRTNYEHSHAVHCNFIAKPKTAPLKPGDFSEKLFFAELFPMRDSRLYLTHCSMLDGGENESRKGCNFCPSDVISHPLSFKDGFKLPLENDEGFSMVHILETPLASDDFL